MKVLGASLWFLCLAAGGTAQAPVGDDPVGELSRSAERDLKESIRELTELRDLIATEKLPLAQELTALEERVAQLRREHDAVTRLVDDGNLEIANIEAEAVAREDELTYVGNLLDEYARTFESKLDVSELQHRGAAVEAAVQAAENTALSMSERFAVQLDFACASLERLFDAIGGTRFPGSGVDLNGALLQGQFALVGPVALFRSDGGEAAGLVVPQSGSTNPLIRPLEGALQAGLAALVETGEGLMPLDPSRGGALKALVQKSSVFDVFRKGGPIMWPLLLASVLALGTVVERLFFLSREKLKRDPKALERFFAAVSRGDTEDAIRAGKQTRFYVVRALGYALSHRETSLASALVYAQAQELKRFQRGIPILDTVITLAPLLGLLGTVTGMMGSFALIGGELSAPGAITGGIAEALIATAFGLGIAITALLPFNFLNARTENARHEIESASTQLELLVQPRVDAAPVGGTGGNHSPAGPEVRASSEDEVRHRVVQRRRLDLQRRIAELQGELEDYELPLNASGVLEPAKE